MTAPVLSEPPTQFSGLMESELSDAAAQQQEKGKAEMVAEQRVLVDRAQRGDQGAFDDIFERYREPMIRTAYRIVGDRDMAEDAVQSALIQAWQHLPSLRETGVLRSWLMRIVVNQCISLKRRSARFTMFLYQSMSEQEISLASQAADDARGYMERRWDLAQAVKQLPVKQQSVIILHYYQGMTLPEMAHRMQISQNTLKKRLQAALNNLRRMLGNAEGDEIIFLPDPPSPGGS
ncbi:MAG TPA: RNA polymerase sigma factor [Ktedonobacteraceae bacterium]|nr:RNA polymerase sigma factor [Ktedonobacteraceae bacterium]